MTMVEGGQILNYYGNEFSIYDKSKMKKRKFSI